MSCYHKSMAVYINKNETRSQLSAKVAATLQNRLNQRSLPDADNGAGILQNQRKTTGGGLFWSIIVTLVIVALVGYVILFL